MGEMTSVNNSFFYFALSCSHDIEQQLGSLILATDINRQNEFLIQLKAHLKNQDLKLEDASDRHFMLQVNVEGFCLKVDIFSGGPEQRRREAKSQWYQASLIIL